MPRSLLGKRMLFRDDILDIARRLALSLAEHRPTTVIFLERGGSLVGRTIAKTLDVPAFGLDLRYPLSRFRYPFNFLGFPFKEIAYRLTSPSISNVGDLAITGPVALVDDSASTGRSLRLALKTLFELGIPASAVKTAVIRCGPRARSLVDFYEIGVPTVFFTG